MSIGGKCLKILTRKVSHLESSASLVTAAAQHHTLVCQQTRPEGTLALGADYPLYRRSKAQSPTFRNIGWCLRS